ncbi:MAG: hypothetical protein JW810_06155, partial [Sedimentisphaerales bacterium]|nr:hypothetical protein [Sedimentisphaerales bacterium]
MFLLRAAQELHPLSTYRHTIRRVHFLIPLSAHKHTIGRSFIFAHEETHRAIFYMKSSPMAIVVTTDICRHPNVSGRPTGGGDPCNSVYDNYGS